MVALQANATTCSDGLAIFPRDAVVDLDGGIVVEGVGAWERTVAHLPQSNVHFVSDRDRIQANVRLVNVVPGRFAQVAITAAQSLKAGTQYRIHLEPPAACLPKSKSGFLPKPNTAEDLIITAKRLPALDAPVALSLGHVEGCLPPECAWRGAVLKSGAPDGGRLLVVTVQEKSTGDSRRAFVEEDNGSLELFEAACTSGVHWSAEFRGEVCVVASNSSPSLERPKTGAAVCFTLPSKTADGGR